MCYYTTHDFFVYNRGSDGYISLYCIAVVGSERTVVSADFFLLGLTCSSAHFIYFSFNNPSSFKLRRLKSQSMGWYKWSIVWAVYIFTGKRLHIPSICHFAVPSDVQLNCYVACFDWVLIHSLSGASAVTRSTFSKFIFIGNLLKPCGPAHLSWACSIVEFDRMLHCG